MSEHLPTLGNFAERLPTAPDPGGSRAATSGDQIRGGIDRTC